jgi:hypothetical protein
MQPKPTFSDYIVYVDESGDHGLESVNPDYPIFVLAFCVFNKQTYINSATPALQQFKLKYFGHDMVVLHEHELRKAANNFKILIQPETRYSFMSDLGKLIQDLDFTIISVVIEKLHLKEKYIEPHNPYNMAMMYGLERVFNYLHGKEQHKTTPIIFESRGKKEDQELELEFRRVCDGKNYLNKPLPFEIIFGHKQTNTCGLQIADLVARPIGRYILLPEQENQAFTILKEKLYCDNLGCFEGLGIKHVP